MDAPTFENLDIACAKAGKDIAAKPSKELKKLVTDALAVLEEQGLYALFLFLKTGNGKGTTEKLRCFLKKTPRQGPLLSDNADLFTSLQEMANDLDKLFLAHDLVRQSLVYARYHARLWEESEVRT